MDSEEAVRSRVSHSAAVESGRKTGSRYFNGSDQEGSPASNSQMGLPQRGWLMND